MAMKRLLLAGGGHPQVEVLRRFAVERDESVAISVVNPQSHSAYSGMLPGPVAGHYAIDSAAQALGGPTLAIASSTFAGMSTPSSVAVRASA